MTRRSGYLLLCLYVLAAWAPADAQVLYGTSAQDSPGVLYTINPATGVATAVGPLQDSMGNPYAITGLAVQPGTGILYGSTPGINPTNATKNSIVTINPATAIVTLLHTGTPNGPVVDLTFTPNGALWGWLKQDNALVSINTTTGVVTEVGPSGIAGSFGGGIAANGSGVIYLAARGNNGPLFVVNSATGLATAVATLSGTSGDAIDAMAFSPTGTLFGVVNSTPPHLATINTTTGAITDIGTTANNLDAIVFTGTAGGANTMSIFGGNNQSTAVNSAFPSPLAVRIVDASFNPVSGASVTFSAPGSGASGTFAGSPTVTTNASGVATAPTFTANGTAGTYGVTATTGALSQIFTLTNTAVVSVPTTMTIVSGNNQTVVVNAALPTALAVKIVDQLSNPVSGVAVTFTPPSSGAGGAFTGSATVTTNAQGVATAPTFTANGTAGAFTVTATAGALSQSFTLTNSTAAPPTIPVMTLPWLLLTMTALACSGLYLGRRGRARG